MNIQYRNNKWNAEQQSILYRALEVITKYRKMSMNITLRQLYYQMVTLNVFANTEKNYKKFGKLISKARYNGLIDWDVIEDHARSPDLRSEFRDLTHFFNRVIPIYRLPRWSDQEYYLELLSEKDAMTNIIQPIAREWHINYCFNRGYSSSTVMFDLAMRIGEALEKGKKAVILYLGDHDPSGLDMVRDVEDRVTEFICEGRGTSDDEPLFNIDKLHLIRKDLLTIDHIALTDEQIEQYHPPPNPAKFKDPRAKDYISKYGRVSWEVDALPPEALINLVNAKIQDYITDHNKYSAWLKQEDDDKAAMWKLTGAKKK